MDERFRDKRLWIGLGGLAIVFLCIAMCGMASLAMFTLRQGPAYAPVPYSQPPAADDGTLPPATNYGYGPMGIGRHSGFSPFGFVAKLFVAGMVGLLALGLLKRVLWGGRHCAPHHWRGHHHRYPRRGRPPEGHDWQGGPPGWAWRGHCWAGEADADPSGEPPPGERASGEYAPGEPVQPEAADAPYTGPQE